MKTIQEIKKAKEDRVTKLIETCGMFFAFSTEQFQNNKTPIAEGEKYVHLGAGAYLPKSQVDNYLNGIEQIRKLYTQEVKENKQRRANILYELNNYEAFYTYDLDETMSALGEGYTIEEVREVFNQEKNKAA